MPWERSREPLAEGLASLLRDLNHLQTRHPALSQWDCDSRGYEWLNGDDAAQSVIAYLRRSDSEALAVVLNATPVPRHGYRVPVPDGGEWVEVFNSDSAVYGGSDMLNRDNRQADHIPMNGREYSLLVDLPPLAGVVLKRA